MTTIVRFFIALQVLLCGCAEHILAEIGRDTSRGQPAKDIAVEEVPVRGFQLGVVYSDYATVIEGELLAVEGGTIWLLNNGRKSRLPIWGINKLELLGLSPPSAGVLGAWTTIGSLSTISHGFFLVFSLPIWLVGGISATVGQSHVNRLQIPLSQIGKLHQYARYPQGMPKSKPLPSSNEKAASSPPGETVAAPTAEPPPESMPQQPPIDRQPMVEAAAVPETVVAPVLPISATADKKSAEEKPLGGTRMAGAFLAEGQKALWGKGEIEGIDDKEVAWNAADAAAREAIAELLEQNGIKMEQGSQNVINETPISDRRLIDPNQKRIFSAIVVPIEALGLKAEEAEALWKALVLQNPKDSLHDTE